MLYINIQTLNYAFTSGRDFVFPGKKKSKLWFYIMHLIIFALPCEILILKVPLQQFNTMY